MATKRTMELEPELLDYDEMERDSEMAEMPRNEVSKSVKGSYASVHSLGFKDFLLRGELLRAIVDCGFEHPSEVQHECIPQAVLGMDILSQAKSGMGKTAVFVIATLQQLSLVKGQTGVLVLCHVRELAFQIHREYVRFAKYFDGLKVSVFFGGIPMKQDEMTIRDNHPHIVVGTPGRILALAREKKLNLGFVKHFIIDECDKVLEKTDMRQDVQDIFKFTPRNKQVMMFSATLPKEVRPTCKLFMRNPLEVFIDDETKLTLNGLRQHYVKVRDNEKNNKLIYILDNFEFNQVIIFVSSVQRCIGLTHLLMDQEFPCLCIHSSMPQDERITRYEQFKDFKKRILISTNIFGRGIDIERVNIVVNYDIPEDTDTYLHRVARAGRFGTKGLAVSFVSNENDAQTMNLVQERFDVSITDLPESLDPSDYIEK